MRMGYHYVLGLCWVLFCCTALQAQPLIDVDFDDVLQAPQKAQLQVQSPAKLAESRHGQALQLDGTTGYAKFPSYGNPQTYSAQAWVMLNKHHPFSIIFCRRNKVNQWQLWVDQYGRLTGIIWGKDGKEAWYHHSDKIRLVTGRWYHVAMAIDADQHGSLFLNGQQLFDIAPTSMTQVGASDLQIGGNGGDRTFDGQIDDVRIYDQWIPQTALDQARQDSSLVYDFSFDSATPTTNAGIMNKPIQLDDQVQCVDGKFGKALQFNGKKAVVVAPNFGNPATFTAEAWFNVQQFEKHRNMIFFRREKANQFQVWMEPDGRLYAYVWGDKSQKAWIGSTHKGLLPKTWYHVAFTIDAKNNAALYLNGQLIDEHAPAFQILKGKSNLHIGCDARGEHIFNGLIDQVRVYESVITPQRLEEIHQQSLPDWQQPHTPDQAMGFESSGAWMTAPLDAVQSVGMENLWSNRTRGGDDWQIPAAHFNDMASGLTFSKEHVRQGKISARWADPARYPTLVSYSVKHDWQSDNHLSIDIYSEQNTGHTLTLGILSDNDQTPYRDYFTARFKVDWQGWKTLKFAFESFESLGQPVGWNKVDAVYFFAKAYGEHPNPYAVLYLDNMRLLSETLTAAKTQTVKENQPFVFQTHEVDQPQPLNHHWPETDRPHSFSQAICHENYFLAERATLKYYPKFTPGYPSYAPDGKVYINARTHIQWLDQENHWQTSDIKKVLVQWGQSQGWKRLKDMWGSQGADPTIRFDLEGGIYVLQQVRPLDAQGKEISPKLRTSLLLYSNDKMKSWQVYRLPSRIASFEKVDGHNQSSLKRPPVILLGDYKYFKWADQAGYILIPQKNADGTLQLPKPVEYASDCLMINYHSGDANVALTDGDRVYIVFGWCPYPSQRKGDWQASRPSMPQEHPGFLQQFAANRGQTWHSRDGVPTFIVTYDIPTGKISKPVYIGSGGGKLDDHNWPAITMDSHGVLHVVINGHHNPPNYIHSLSPHDSTRWSDPQYILVETDRPNLSYATLNCDRSDTLYLVGRSTKDVYNNHLGLYRKPAGKPWEKERTVVAPYRYMYGVWNQRMAYDPLRDRMLLTYHSQAQMMQLSRDQYDFYVFAYPDAERVLSKNWKPDAGSRASNAGPQKKGGFYVYPASETCTLLSDDHWKTWRLARTPDFELPADN